MKRHAVRQTRAIASLVLVGVMLLGFALALRAAAGGLLGPPTQPARCAVHNFWRGRLVHRYRWILLAGDAQVAARLGSFDNSSDFSCSIRDKQNGSALVKSEAVAREPRTLSVTIRGKNVKVRIVG